jgi:RND family efflux transporter MFP subunit
MEDSEKTIAHDLSELTIKYDDCPKKRIKRYLIVLPIALLIFTMVTYSVIIMNKTIEVSIATAQIVSTQHNHTILNASGYVTPLRRSTVASKITGRIIEISFEEGRFVEKGEVLARLDDADAKVQVETAKANLDVAKAATYEYEIDLFYAKQTLSRHKKLFSKNVISRQQYDQYQRSVISIEAKIELAKKEIVAAHARLKSAQQDLENYTVTAPFSGLITSKSAQVGEIVSPVSWGGGYTRTGIATIVDMESLGIEVDVNESNIAQVKVGQTVIAILDAYPDWQISAKVQAIIPTADRIKATVKVRIGFDQIDPKILPDMGVKVSFLAVDQADEDNEACIKIPHAAVREEGGSQFVYLFNNGFIERRSVVVGQIIGTFVKVDNGLSANEKVVITDAPKIKDGQKARLITDRGD